jgi:hypothetical protein
MAPMDGLPYHRIEEDYRGRDRKEDGPRDSDGLLYFFSLFFSRIASFFSCSILLGKTRWGLERFKNTFEVLQIVWFVSFN